MTQIRKKPDETVKEYNRRYWYTVTKPKLIAEREKQAEEVAQKIGLEMDYDPIIEMMEEYQHCREALEELEQYVDREQAHPMLGGKASTLEAVADLRARKMALNKELLPFFHSRLSSSEQKVTIEDTTHQISDEPLTDDAWNNQYGVAPTNGASKSTH